jgi:glycerol-3-phosphate dehydrogenase subunit C
VAIYVTYVNFNEPGIGHDLLALLTHNEIPYVLVTSKACCGMPLLKQVGSIFEGVQPMAISRNSLMTLEAYAKGIRRSESA